MPKANREYTEVVSLRLSREQLDKLKSDAEELGLSQSDYLRRLIEGNILCFDDLSEKMKEKLEWRRRARRRATMRELVLEALRQGLGLSRWG